MTSVVVPAFDEEGAIAQTIAAIRATEGPETGPIDVVVVDDGSKDATAAIAASAGARVVRHAHNLGYGRALKSGIEAAQHDTIVIVDADGTYPIADIPRLVACYTRGFDMVVGARTGKAFRESTFKALMRRILTFLVEFTAGRRVPDVNSGFRVFSRSTALHYFNHLCDTFSFTTSMTLAYMMTARFVTYEPIGYVERVGRTKVKLLRDALRTLQYIVQAIVYYNPIKIFLILSALAVIAGAGGAALAVVWSVPIAALVASLGVLVALMLFGIGLIADLLRQIMRK